MSANTAEIIGGKCFSLPVSGMHVSGYDFESPGKLGGEAKDFLFSGLFPVGLEAFEKNASPEFDADVKEHIFACDHLVVLRADGTIRAEEGSQIGSPRPIAFLVWKTYDSSIGRVLLISGVCVKVKWQGHGFGNRLIQYAVETCKPEIVFLTTQNPVMKQSLDRAIGKVTIPSLREGDWPGKTLDPVGEYLAALLGKSQIYDSRTHVLRGNYGSSLYKKQPVSRDGEYNSLFGRLNYHEGDAYLCYAHIGGGN